MRLLLVFAVVLVAAVAQKPEQQQGRLLSPPEADLCSKRPKHWNFNNHNYFFSWDAEGPGFYENDDPNEPNQTQRKVNWLIARNECRRRCMDAVSMETQQENDMIFEFIRSRNITYIWTSGRLCDFTGCKERADLHPININGWFWSSTNTKMAPTNKIPPGWDYQPWSSNGHHGGPQPDNAEFGINNTTESCLGVLNNLYNDGIKWHDIACYHPKPFICEDSDLLLDFIRQTNRGISL